MNIKGIDLFLDYDKNGSHKLTIFFICNKDNIELGRSVIDDIVKSRLLLGGVIDNDNILHDTLYRVFAFDDILFDGSYRMLVIDVKNAKSTISIAKINNN